MFLKGNQAPYFSKGFGQQLGAGKQVAGILDNPLVQAGVGVLAPEIAVGLAAAKKYGLLERVKHL